MLQKVISAPCLSTISRRALMAQKVIDEMIIGYYILDGKFFSEFLNGTSFR